MKYKRFILENFKGIKKIELSLEKINQPISLVGLNESGKTTILKGIWTIGKHCELLAKSKGQPLLENGERNKMKPKTGAMFFGGDIIFSCVIGDNNSNNTMSFIYKFENDRFQKYVVKKNNEEVNFDDEAVSSFIKNLSTNAPKVLLYDDFTLNIPEEIKFYTTYYKSGQTPEMLESIEKEEKKEKNNSEWRLILQDILSSMDKEQNVTFQKNVVDYLDGENAGNRNNFADLLKRIESHINKKIIDKWLKNLDKDSSLGKITFECNEQQKNVNQRSFSFKVISKQGNTFNLSDRSKGCQWFFAFMLFTEFRKHRNDNTIFLLDEPASNLHASIQEKVVDAINELYDEATGTKVMYSTHSPYLLEINDNTENIFLMRNINGGKEDKQAKVEIHPFKEAIKNSRYKKEVRPLLDYVNLNLDKIIEDKKGKKTFENKDIHNWIKNSLTILTILEKIKKVFF